MTDVYCTRVFEEQPTQHVTPHHHVCFVCGDTIELTAQVCSRFCMRALEQLTELDKLDSLEAQVESPKHSDYNNSSVHHFKIVPEQRSEAQLTEEKTDAVQVHTTY